MWVSVKKEDAVVKINTDFIIMVDEKQKAIMLTSGNMVHLSDDQYDVIYSKLFTTRKPKTKDDTEMYDFLNELHNLLGNKGRVSLTGDRRRGLETLFKEGFTKEEIITAAFNIGQSDFMRGKNDRKTVYAKVDYLFRKSNMKNGDPTWNINRWQEGKQKKQNNLF